MTANVSDHQKADRLGAVALIAAAVVALRFIVHESIAGAGMGTLLDFMALPVMGLALVAWAAAAQRLSQGARRVSLVAAVLLAAAPWTLLRTAGIMGDGSEFHWRWTPTPEQKLLAQANDEPAPLPPSAPTPVVTPETPTSTPTATPDDKAAATPATTASPNASASPTPSPAAPAKPPAEWPGFRGRNRDGVVRGVQIKTDWTAAPPVELWRKPIGPGWSSFAVRGELLYTQEQRGEDEIVACYKVATGEPVWRHRDAVRFWESNAGAGPRATPTLSGNRVYAFGATGILNALDAANGKRLWSNNVAADTERKVPEWGFASLPLLVNDLVVVAAAGTLAAYGAADGKLRWKGPSYGSSYSSPHRATIDGVPQILLLGGPGALSVAPTDGALLWEHKWESGAIAQPALLTNGDIIVNALAVSGGLGTRRLAVKQDAGKRNRMCCSCCRKKANSRWSAPRPASSRNSRASACWTARPGIIQSWRAICCLCATVNKWPRSVCLWRVVERTVAVATLTVSVATALHGCLGHWPLSCRFLAWLIAAQNAAEKTGHLVSDEEHPAERQKGQQSHAQQ
jgi:outer membrane protein assembly factor BamB